MAVQELALVANHRGMSLPQLTGPKLERVKRCPRDFPTHSVMQMQVVTVYNERKSKLAGVVFKVQGSLLCAGASVPHVD